MDIRQARSAAAFALLFGAAGVLAAHEPPITSAFDRARCTFTTAGSNPYYPLLPGHGVELEGEEVDDGETVELAVRITVTLQTQVIDGVLTRVVEEYEEKDDELEEVSRNFVAICRETGDVWYFGEDVDNYEDGVLVDHDGGWRAGVDGAQPGILVPGTPFAGARFFEEQAPGEALDYGEVVDLAATVETPAGTYQNVLKIDEHSTLDLDDFSEKYYARGIGLIGDTDPPDEAIWLTEVTAPACVPDATTHCLANGRFAVESAWRDFQGNSGDGQAILSSDKSGEFWFFNSGNTELLVKVLDGCTLAVPRYWVFAGGLTNVEVTITVTDTKNGAVRTYHNALGSDMAPVLDTDAFATCP